MRCDDDWDKLKKYFIEQSQIEAIKAAKSNVSENKAKEYENGTIDGNVANAKRAKECMRRSLGKIIKSKDGEEARLSSNSIDKIISKSAIRSSMEGKKFTAIQHLAVAADIENLFKNSINILTHQDKRNNPNIKAIHRFAAPLYGDKVALITVKEATIEGKRIYSVELLELGGLEGKMGRIKFYPTPSN